MFVSHEKNVSKKTFQKPNILRKSSKVSKPRANLSNVESPVSISLVNNSYGEEASISYSLDNITSCETETPTNLNQSVWKLTLTNTNENKADDNLHGNPVDVEVTDSSAISTEITNVEKSFEQSSLNIESFINGGGNAETMPLHFVENTPSPEEDSTNVKTEWRFDITNNATDIIIENCNDSLTDEVEQRQESVIVVPSSLPSDFTEQQIPAQEQVSDEPTPVEIMPVEYFSNRAIKYKCDHPNCSKGFWSEEKLKKHKNSHNRPVVRTPTQAVIECPVKKINIEGLEERCPQTFQVRSDLLKHLNEDHTPEDASYRCGVCGRRFFWAGGLRAHGASLCARGGLACGWPGCGRVFRLPCRLREHARAHTGDRPYRCRYPECGWAFRSASKLVRHARRHTDERRHACGACGRAFLRREHLRDHAARHHLPSARVPHRCTHPGTHTHTTCPARACRTAARTQVHAHTHTTCPARACRTAARTQVHTHTPPAQRARAAPLHAPRYTHTHTPPAQRARAAPLHAPRYTHTHTPPAQRARAAPLHAPRYTHTHTHHLPSARVPHRCTHPGTHTHTTCPARAQRARAAPLHAPRYTHTHHLPSARVPHRCTHPGTHTHTHHLPSARVPHRCTHPGCEQSFTNMSTLYTHMKKVHRKEAKDCETSNSPDEPTVRVDGDNIYLVSLVDEAPVIDEDSSRVEAVARELEAEAAAALVAEDGGAGGAGGAGEGAEGAGGAAEGRAARTHCTWPLARHTQLHHYVLDDDTHVERAEGSGSDVYTVRSDLFLHGNAPIDEDSQHIVGAGEEVAPLDADLCLIDAHPTIDLMQEELMYEDAAVDESSFRVFLMNGEELT
ncbi:unnamed protein product [Chrysodeixis includens]|uniref:C2H2-type domain-containing protein n=1 Tax=Chrysodeixis includens TaxID=689277 RepID=A0A9P0BWY9_CHRIL|nr:unnamed protein product [Chrysodeixis includens]